MWVKKSPCQLKAEAYIRKQKKARDKAAKKKAKGVKRPPYESNKELKRLSYKEFLQTKYWAHVRKLVLKRDKFVCVICKCDVDLQVHHDTYKNHFDELNHLEDLITLCRKCHKEHHYAQM